ncbi:4'-phosphopantetheinyl transferase superfamily protein [Paenibacillus sp. CFBP 13594]|uniref:4'-phosphopantetheinyl transferase family protein n=1 Tax=Paenibacillus sp. CFBP 13594 TaxID=2774037 RepID=UPI00177E187B|nr:4'-phosphopantetheinyl transferase superfamily protein [Paenibacillus sp. CFBP 13594]MBD8841034.1 4'-phosphopantetheinyl transferase superfamily protein [Paenibacillus sp. CFBP 13594]
MESRTGTISSLLAMREQGNDTFTPFSGEPEVHIWTQTLPIREDQLQTATTMESDAMTVDEHERMARISTTSRLQAHCWMISRVFLRRVLAQYMQLQARDIRFEYGTSGKPYLVGGPQFSLSHTNGLCVLAIASSNNAIGIDVEWVRPLIREQAIIQRFLTEEERDYVLEAMCSGEDSSFLLWNILTGKEAWIKASGQSLCGQWRNLNTAQAINHHEHLLKWAGQKYVLQSLKMGKGYSASLCVTGSQIPLIHWMNMDKNMQSDEGICN